MLFYVTVIFSKADGLKYNSAKFKVQAINEQRAYKIGKELSKSKLFQENFLKKQDITITGIELNIEEIEIVKG